MRSRPEKRQRYEGMRLHRVSVFREPHLIESYSCARRIRRWRGLRHPKQKLPLFPNNQFISCTIENVDSAWVSRIGVRSIPARARENDSGFFPSSPAQVRLRVCRKSCCRIKTQPCTPHQHSGLLSTCLIHTLPPTARQHPAS